MYWLLSALAQGTNSKEWLTGLHMALMSYCNDLARLCWPSSGNTEKVHLTWNKKWRLHPKWVERQQQKKEVVNVEKSHKSACVCPMYGGWLH